MSEIDELLCSCVTSSKVIQHDASYLQTFVVLVDRDNRVVVPYRVNQLHIADGAQRVKNDAARTVLRHPDQQLLFFLLAPVTIMNT